MIISPPELVPFSHQRYISDLEYRFECDLEIQAERHERIQHLFHRHLLHNEY